MNGFLIKVLTAFLILFTFNFITSCMEDVCPPPILYYLRDVKVKPIHTIENGTSGFTIEYTDTLWNEIAFEVRPEIELALLKRRNNIGLMNVAYGDCAVNFPLNPTLPDAAVFSCDKPIYWNGITIEANTNLLEHSVFHSLIDFPTYFDYESYGIVEIQTDNLKLPRGDYEFHFEWTTDDGTILSDNIEVYIDL